MSQTTPPTITAAPAVPIRGASTFKTAVDAFLTWMAAAVSQFSAVATNVYNNAVDCYNNATAASTSATAASGSATSAAASAGAVLWASGTTYAQFARVISRIDGKVYFRSTASGSGTTDPSADTTNYAVVINGNFPTLHVREEQASGVAPADTLTTAAFTTRTLNTVKTNTIPGASLASNTVTLPAGTYYVAGTVPQEGTSALGKATLYNTSDSGYALIGANGSVSNAAVLLPIRGQFTIAATKTFQIKHYVNSASTAGHLAGSSQVEVYSELYIQKVA